MNRRMPESATLRQQNGAALIVGLILMLVLTVLGVSGMTVSVLGLTMASNAQFQQNTFQAAETGIDVTLDTANLSSQATQNFPNAYADADYSADTVMTYATDTIYFLSAFSAGVGEGSVSALHYDIQSDATGPDGARSVHTQSFYIAGPPQ